MRSRLRNAPSSSMMPGKKPRSFSIPALPPMAAMRSKRRSRKSIHSSKWNTSAPADKLLGKYLTEARNNTFLADVYQGSVFPLATLQQRGIARPSPTPFMTACGQGRLLGTRGVERHDHRLQAGWSKATRSRRITKISYCPSGRASSASISTKPHGTSSARKTKTVTATSITSTSGER